MIVNIPNIVDALKPKFKERMSENDQNSTNLKAKSAAAMEWTFPTLCASLISVVSLSRATERYWSNSLS